MKTRHRLPTESKYEGSARKGSAGNTVAAVPARIGLLVVTARVDDQRGSIGIEQGIWPGTQLDPRHLALGPYHPAAANRQIAQVPGVRSVGAKMAMLALRRIPMRTGSKEARILAPPDLMQVHSQRTGI